MPRADRRRRLEKLKSKIPQNGPVQVPDECNCRPVFCHSHEELFAMIERRCPVHGLRDVTPFCWVSHKSLFTPELCLCGSAELISEHQRLAGLSPDVRNTEFRAKLSANQARVSEYLIRLGVEVASDHRLHNSAQVKRYIADVKRRG